MPQSRFFFEVGANTYEFDNEFISGRSTFSHKCDMKVNGKPTASGRKLYYNRTWEAYTYQSVMAAIVKELSDELPDKEPLLKLIMDYDGAN